MGEAIRATLASGGTVYWHTPTQEAFHAMQPVLGADNLEMQTRSAEHPCGSGKTRCLPASPAKT